MTREDIGLHVSRYISKNFLFDEAKSVGPGQSLLGTGVLDSTGILELITYLESNYKLKFDDQELVAENFDTVDRIAAFISAKLNHLNG